MVISTAPQITYVLDSFTAKQNGIPGVVFRAIQKDGSILYEGASGSRGLEHKGEPMTNDTLFWIASCTKLLTAISALQLVEKGKISLDDHVEKYLPEVGKHQILTGFDEGDLPIFHEHAAKITTRQLLTHTSGFAYDMLNPLICKYSRLFNIPNIMATKRSTLLAPLVFEPGTKWEYGTSIDWLGQIIEVVTGQSLGAYMQEFLFEPLGIHSTTFVTSSEQNSQHAYMHSRSPDKTLSETQQTIAYGEHVEMHGGGGGSHSKASDYTTILHALLNDGVGATGNPILTKESVDLLFFSQSTPSLDIIIPGAMPELSNPIDMGTGVPKAWTFGGLKLDVEMPTGRSSGSVWWAGLPNCFWWIDRTKGVAGVILTQILPFNDEEVAKCWAECEKLVYEGL